MGYIDLHLHLDGAITVDIAKKLAKLQGITLPESEGELEKRIVVPSDCQSLNDFLKCFAFPLSLLQTPEGLSEAVRLVADHIMEQGVVYAEIRFAPQLHTEKGMTQEDAVLAALEGLKKTRLKCNLILCCMRGPKKAQLSQDITSEVPFDKTDPNEETLRLAAKYLVEDGGVVAIDLAGAEALFPTEDYRELFAEAKALGIPFTIHAGEADGAQSVKLALEYGARRIGHGVRSFEDPEVMALLKQKGIPLEMCPTSNRMTHAVEDMSVYPLKSYLAQGLKVTLNTDDMAIEGITLAEEFAYAREALGMTREEEKKVLQNAIDAAFTTRQVKEELSKKLYQ